MYLSNGTTSADGFQDRSSLIRWFVEFNIYPSLPNVSDFTCCAIVDHVDTNYRNLNCVLWFKMCWEEYLHHRMNDRRVFRIYLVTVTIYLRSSGATLNQKLSYLECQHLLKFLQILSMFFFDSVVFQATQFHNTQKLTGFNLFWHWRIY